MRRKVLFVCTGNWFRSPTAEHMYKGRDDLDVKSAGTLPGVPTMISPDLIDWADMIFAMMEEHRASILEISPEAQGKIVVLGIPDIYSRDQPELKDLLRRKLKPYLGELQP